MVDRQPFTTLMVSAVTTTAPVGPIVRIMTTSSRSMMPYTWHTIQHSKPNADLRILACIHSQDQFPSILSLLDTISISKDNPICVYAMHVADLVGRATPLLITHKPNKKSTLTSYSSSSIFGAFHSFERHFQGHVVVQPFTSVASSISIHKDVCSSALHQNVTLRLVPFHKQQSVGGGLNSVDPVLQVMNPNILREAPCSVGIVVDRSSCFRGRFACAVMVGSNTYNVGLFFLGGPDDREVLAYAAHMGDQPRVSITVWRFMSREGARENNRERRADDELVSSFRERHARNARVQYKDLVLADGEELLNMLRTVEDVYDLVMVGRHPALNVELVEGLSLWSENPELGLLGDLFSSSDFFGGTASVLIMPQQILRRVHS